MYEKGFMRLVKMNVNSLMPLLVVVICNVCYHLASKNMSNTANPFIGLVATYGVACLIGIITFLITSKSNLIMEISSINISNILLGLLVVGIEGGYIIMYRLGWEISKGSLISNICVAILLIIAGSLFFKEVFTIQKAIGVVICIIGIFLMNK
ncbi:transporter [Clostridium thailandense]|uniref:transporter n=1 Tax=Clostridium thailandense TaxID=2794346 RepID=UPI00398A0919